jgi:hypothetical protein
MTRVLDWREVSTHIMSYILLYVLFYLILHLYWGIDVRFVWIDEFDLFLHQCAHRMYARNFKCKFLACAYPWPLWCVCSIDSAWLLLDVSTHLYRIDTLTHVHKELTYTQRSRKSVSLTVSSLLPTGNLASDGTNYPRCRSQSSPDWAPWGK